MLHWRCTMRDVFAENTGMSRRFLLDPFPRIDPLAADCSGAPGTAPIHSLSAARIESQPLGAARTCRVDTRKARATTCWFVQSAVKKAAPRQPRRRSVPASTGARASDETIRPRLAKRCPPDRTLADPAGNAPTIAPTAPISSSIAVSTASA